MVKLNCKPRGVENLSSKLVCSIREFNRSSLGELKIPVVLLKKKKEKKKRRNTTIYRSSGSMFQDPKAYVSKGLGDSERWDLTGNLSHCLRVT